MKLIMKQTSKKVFGIVAAVAILSGITGAFSFAAINKWYNKNDESANKELTANEVEEIKPQLMKLSNASTLPSQHIDLTDAAEKGCNAVVYIKVVMNGKTRMVEYRDPFEEFFGEFFGQGNGGIQRRQVQTPKREASGSGVIISEDGYIVTNNHVVENADVITVTLNDNREFTARVIGCDSDTDLALIKIEGDNLPCLVIGDSDAVKVGEWVLAVGNPFNLTSTVTAGIISAKARSLGANRSGIESFIQTDAAINKGNSGGALINARGELIGINTMLYSNTGSYSGYGFAIPTSIMKKVVTDLKMYGTVQRAMLGIEGVTLKDFIEAEKAKEENFKADFGTVDGVYVYKALEEGAAAEAGLKEGDVIISIDGKKVTKMSELQEATTKFRPGDKTSIKFMREGKVKSTTIMFRNAKGTTNVMKSLSMDILGAEFTELTEEQKKKMEVNYGVQVSKLKNGKLKEAGITEKFIILKVNNQNIKSVGDLETVFRIAQNSDDQTLWIWGKSQSGKPQSFAINLAEE